MSRPNKVKCFTVTWELKTFKDIAHWCKHYSIESPTFKMGTILQENCELFLRISEDSKNFHVQVCNVQELRIPYNCIISVLSSEGEVLQEEKQTKEFVIQKNTVFNDDEEWILPNDTLTVRCKILDKTLETGKFSIHSTIHHQNYLWIIKNYDLERLYSETFIEKDNFLFYMSLDPGDKKVYKRIITGAVPIKDGTLKFLYGKWSVKDEYLRGRSFDKYNDSRTAGKCEIRIPKKYRRLDLQLELESIYFANVTSGTVPKFPNAPSNDIRSLYKEQLHTDATLNTADGKSFRAHRSILAARSSVFRAMFERQEMREGRSGVVDIDDVDSETVYRMLAFLYSDSLDDLQWEEAAALYYAADKYDVHILKKKCTDILKAGLTVDNACDALILADKHSEKELSACVVDFICDHQEVVSSAKWKKLEEKNLRLTHEILRSSFLQCKRRK